MLASSKIYIIIFLIFTIYHFDFSYDNQRNVVTICLSNNYQKQACVNGLYWNLKLSQNQLHSQYAQPTPQQSYVVSNNKYLNCLFADLKIKDLHECHKIFHKSVEELQALFALEPVKFKHDLLQDDSLPNDLIWKMFDAYQVSCGWWHNQNLAEYRQDVQRALQQRDDLKKFYQQHQERQQKNIKEQQEQKQLKHFQNIYHDHLLSLDSYQSPCHQDRQQALEETKKQQCKKYEKNHELDAQTIGLCLAKNIDYKKLQKNVGTALQHQLYDEVACVYKQIANFLCKPTLSESILVSQSLEFAEQAVQATQLEAMDLAIALSDMVNIASSIVIGMGRSVSGFIEFVLDPVSTAQNLGNCLGRLMNYVAQAMVYADGEIVGWSYYAQVLEREHGYDAWYAYKIIDAMAQSFQQEKIIIVSKLIADAIVYPRFINVLSRVSKTCCGLIAELSDLKFLQEFTDVYAEYGLTKDFEEIGLRNMQDIASSIMSSECNFLQQEQVKKVGQRLANSVNAQDALARKMNALQKAQDRVEKGIVTEKKLFDGRIRYYEKERLSKTLGATRGSSHVTEYNSKTGQVRAWGESYDHNGNVNRISPKMIDGQILISQHYPPTGKEIEYWKKIKESFE